MGLIKEVRSIMGKQSAKFDTLLLAIDLLIMAAYCIITTYTDSEFSVSVFDGGNGGVFCMCHSLDRSSGYNSSREHIGIKLAAPFS